MFFGCSLGMDQIMTLNVKLIGYWLNLEQAHHRPRKPIQNYWLILLYMFMFIFVHVCNIRRFWFTGSNELHFLSWKSETMYWTMCPSIAHLFAQLMLIYLQTRFHIIFTFVFTLNGIYMISQKVFHCADVICVPPVNM